MRPRCEAVGYDCRHICLLIGHYGSAAHVYRVAFSHVK